MAATFGKYFVCHKIVLLLLESYQEIQKYIRLCQALLVFAN